jgi:hypothetical protein
VDFIGLVSSDVRNRQSAAIIAKAIADSEAATAKIKITKISPVISLKKIEPVTKFKLTESKRISIDISVTNKLFLFKIIPNNPTIKRIKFKYRQYINFSVVIGLKE